MFPRKVCVNVNVYTDRCEFVFLLILCFLLQEENKAKEEKFLSTVTKYEESDRNKTEMVTELKHNQVSYIFSDCTIKFTSPKLLACSSTGENPDYLHVHKNYTSFT